MIHGYTAITSTGDLPVMGLLHKAKHMPHRKVRMLSGNEFSMSKVQQIAVRAYHLGVQCACLCTEKLHVHTWTTLWIGILVHTVHVRREAVSGVANKSWLFIPATFVALKDAGLTNFLTVDCAYWVRISTGWMARVLEYIKGRIKGSWLHNKMS
jgi:hypothetical protein